MSSKLETKSLVAGAALVCCMSLGAPAAHAVNTQAATNAANGPACNAARPFYWEIGGYSGAPLVSGQVGGTQFNRNTTVNIASASKWPFGAYVLQRYGGIPGGSSGNTIMSALNMLEGHTNFSTGACSLTRTVEKCHTVGDNDVVDPSKVGFFNYGGGDGQYAAAAASLLNLGPLNTAGLLSEVNSYLSLGPSFAYNYPGVAGGMSANAAHYVAFLQKLMNGTYVMSNYLGHNSVATQCAACSSPYGTADMHYAQFYWIEDNTGGSLPNGTPLTAGDGVFSSLGAFGFYPWISANKQYYGVISMDGNYEDSYVCGKAIRGAFFN